MATCIPKEIVDNIRNIKNISKMTSEQRRSAFSELVGETQAREVNKLYEKSLTLKNQDRAFGKFVDDINGVSAEKKIKIKEQIKKRLSDKQDVIDNNELLDIVKETLDKKYDLSIEDADVEKLFNIKKEIKKLEKLVGDTPDQSPERLAFGSKVTELSDEIARLKNPEIGVITGVKKSLGASVQRVKDQKDILGKVGTGIGEFFGQVLSLPYKGIKASWDASFLLRQGMKLMTADASVYKKQAGQSLSVWKDLFNSDAMDKTVRAFKADLVSRKSYREAVDSGLAIGVVEDFFPTNMAEKIPGIGNAFKASDASFTMFSQGARMDMYEKYIKELGDKATPEVKKSVARYVNGLTGRGNLEKAEAASGWLNQIFFSARYQVANLKTFSDPLFAKTPEVRKIAAKNLAKHAALIGSLMLTINQFTEVGTDLRSKRFGKAKIGGKWVDVTGGLGSYLSVMGQVYDKMQSKPKYGQSDSLDILIDFMKGKVAPVPGVLRDYLSQRDYDGNKPTPVSVLRSLFVPINADNLMKNIEKDEDVETTALQLLFETLGAGVSNPKK